jgi:TolB-like protein/DNA-binding winged helix-turn-helix (wHTH) protein/Flp pilus assembly protein TadD
MMQAPKTADKVLFSDFELDLSTGELYQHGQKQRLSGQPADVLRYLIRRAGSLVSREELQSALWPTDTFVDFDHGLNSCIQRIRRALGDSVVAPRYIETLPKQGYRFIGEIRFPEEPAPGFGKAPVLPPQAAVPRRRVLQLALGVALLVCVIAAAWIFLVPRWRQAGSNTNRIRSLAVLPMKNLSGDPAQEFFADGMTEELIGRLATIRGLRVISRTSVMQFKDTKLLAPEIASALGVDALVEGSVIQHGNRIRVHAQLIRASTDEHFWSETYDRDLSDVLALQSDVARAIAEKVKASISSEEHSRLAAARQVSPEVYESYLKGRSVMFNTPADTQRSIGYFEEAIKMDHTFAPAYIALANAYMEAGTASGGASPKSMQPKAISAAQKALELDPTLPEPHVLLGLVYQGRWDWSNAEREFKRALELSPNDASAHGGYAGWLLCQGRFEEAQTWERRGRDIDPFTVTGQDLGWVLFQSRHYDEAIRELRSHLAVYPDNPGDLWFLGFALIAKGAPGEAIPVLEKSVTLSDRSPAMIGVLISAYAHAGRRADAMDLLEKLKRRQQKGYIPAAAFVNAYLGLGDKEQAIAWMERAYQEQSMILQYLKVHPFFDPVRDDPRFKDLVRRVGLG